MATSIWKQQSNFNLGTILLGSDYNFLTAYNINDVVSFNGKTFRAIKDNPLVDGQSILPRNLDYWTEFNVEITEGDTFDILLPVNLGSNTTVLQTSAFGGDSTFTDFDNTRFYISSIGIPEHAFGPYPNPQNSFSVDIQNWLFTLPIEPAVAITKVDTPVGPVGIASNGVPIYNHKSSKIDIVEGEALTRNSVLSIQNGAVVVDGSGPPTVLGDYHYLKDPQLLYFKPTNYKELYDDSISYAINQIVSYNNDYWVSNLQSPGSLVTNSNRIVTYARDSKYGFAVNSAVNTFTVGTRLGGSPGAPADAEYNNGAISNVTGDGSDFFKREVTTNGVRIMGAGTVGGQTAVPDAWLEKVARMFELFTDPTGAGINEAFQRNLIKTLSGDAGTWHEGLPTLQRVARGSGADYTPNFLTDQGVIDWNLTPLFDSHVANDMVWYLNSTGDGYGVGEIDAQEVIEHVFHTLHMHGLTDDIKLYSYISADWATGPLYAAMEEAFDAGKWDPSGYQTNPDDWKTDANAFEVAAKEYMFLLNFAMFDYTGLWDGDSLAPEWADDVRTPAQIQTTLPVSYAFFNTYIAPVISKPSLATINSIFGDGNTPAQDDPSLSGASGYVVDIVVGGTPGDVEVQKTTNNVSIFDRENTEFVNTFERDWINYISGVQHSPIIGYALDGYPIYGSLGYSDPLDANSYPKFMTSGYSVRADNRQNGDTRDGYYEEDWAWIENSGTLDIHNGRFCVTPEYPAGTYAYFASVETDAPAVSTYPYLIGKQFYGEPLLDNGTGIREGLNDVTFNVISGELPLGLRIDRQRLRGTPLEIANTTDYDFVIRAKYNSDQVVEDRTFKLTVEGPDDPVWLTAEGNLAVGSNNTFFVLDGDFVDINLLATDNDIAAGQELEFFIGDDSGELPPGLTLTSEGRIFGFTDPVIPLDYNAVTGGGYGSDRYDYNPYDYAIRSQSGYDSFLYDNIGYDEADATRSPRKANRFYEFIVSVNDGDSIARRQFKIFVVGDDAARADNVSSNSDQEIFTADMTFVRKPIFTTPSNLGVKRAGSFITLVIDVFDPNTIIGAIDYQLEPVNVDGSPSILPTGLTLDYITGEVAGRYPYQPEVTREFNFTIRATRYNPNVADVEVSYGYVASAFAVGDTQVLFDPTKSVSLLDTVGSTIYDPVKRKNIEVIAVEEIEQNSVNYVRVTFGQALEFANPNPSTDQMSFAFSTTVIELSNDEYIAERKQFTLRVQGEADGAISWITPSDLGNIAANSVSTANVVAKSTFPGTSVVYKLVSGKLPYGLSLIEDGEIIGKVRQFSSNDELGITIFDNGFLTLDNTATTLDRSYTFTIEARDKFTINAVQRKFTINITPLADRAYSNLYIRPLLAPAKKKEWSEFISNSNVFSTDIIYRPYDENFGIQRNLTSLIYSGIEAKGYGEFAAVTAFGHKPRSLLLGNLKVAEARETAQDDVTYEVLYLELLDPYEKFSTGNLEDLVSANETIILKTPSKPITADQTGADFIKGIIDPEDALYNRQDPAFFRANEQPLTVDSDVNPDAPNKKHISTITNMRNRIQTVGLTDNRFLPLWMKTRQTATGKQPGYVRAVPIAYAKPGTGQQLLLKVNNYIASSDFEFSNFNYFVDRYVIDATLGNSNTQFIVWPKNNKSI
jgi:hypothetical protein